MSRLGWEKTQYSQEFYKALMSVISTGMCLQILPSKHCKSSLNVFLMKSYNCTYFYICICTYKDCNEGCT